MLAVVGPDFERSTGHKLNVVTGQSPNFVKQINSGEPFDIFVAPPAAIDALIKNGKLLADTRTNIVRSGFGVEVKIGAPKPDVSNVEAFKQALLNAKSVGYLSNGGVPELVKRLGIFDVIASKVTMPRIGGVSELVAKGDVELGVNVLTQILTSPGVDLVGPLPADIQYYSTFTAAVGSSSPSRSAARDVIKLLIGPTALPIIRAQGMEPGS